MATSHPKEACGIVGVTSEKPVAASIYYALRALQHRGQESAGIAVFNEDLHYIKGSGLVHEVFKNGKIVSLKGNVGIGHNRYSTAGKMQEKNIQPLVVETSIGKIALAHNGDIVNAETLRADLTAKGYTFHTDADTEIIAYMLARELTQSANVISAIKSVMRRLIGSYSLVILVKDTVIGVRDPLGIKPLCLGTVDSGYMIASESVALDVLDGTLLRDVEPGEVLELHPDGIKSHRVFSTKNAAHCMFEYVYFSRPDSIIDGKAVYGVREALGERLAKEQPVANADIICPIPDSGISYALGFSRISGVPFAEGLIKNRYAWRTFILPSQQLRVAGVKEKLNPVKSLIKDKVVVLVDDSIVRGTTTRRIVQMMRKAGAKEVHVRVGSPPIIAPCYLGIDMHTRDQFIAAEKSFEEIAREITADSIGYVSIDGLVESIGHKKDDLCLGCINGLYPVEIPGEKVRFQQRLIDFE